MVSGRAFRRWALARTMRYVASWLVDSSAFLREATMSVTCSVCGSYEWTKLVALTEGRMRAATAVDLCRAVWLCARSMRLVGGFDHVARRDGAYTAYRGGF